MMTKEQIDQENRETVFRYLANADIDCPEMQTKILIKLTEKVQKSDEELEKLLGTNLKLLTAEEDLVFKRLYYSLNDNIQLSFNEADFKVKCINNLKGSSFCYFYGVEYWADYEILKNAKNAIQYVKVHYFRHPDGSIYKQAESLTEQIIISPNVKAMLILKFFKLLRCLDYATWEKLFQSDPRTIQDLLSIYSEGLVQGRESNAGQKNKIRTIGNNKEDEDGKVDQEEEIRKNLLDALKILKKSKNNANEDIKSKDEVIKQTFSDLDVKDKDELAKQKPKELIPNPDKLEESIRALEKFYDKKSQYNKNPNLHILLRLDISRFADVLSYREFPNIALRILPFFQRAFSSPNEKWDFILAVYLDSIELANQLLQWKSDINKSYHLFFFGEIYQILKDNVSNLFTGMTPLMFASAMGKVRMVDFLLNNGASIDGSLISNDPGFGSSRYVERWVAGKEGYTALMFAVLSGHVDCVRRLLEAKPNVFQSSANGLNAITLAESLKFETIDKMLKVYAKENTEMLRLAPPSIEFGQDKLKNYTMFSNISSIIIRNQDHSFSLMEVTEGLHPFASETTGYSQEQKRRFLSVAYHCINIDPDSCSLQRLGVIRAACQWNGCYYENEFFLLDIHNQDLFEGLRKGDSGLLSKHSIIYNPSVIHDRGILLQPMKAEARSNLNPSVTRFTTEILKIINSMERGREFTVSELKQLTNCYANSIENITKLINHIQKADSKSVAECLASIPKTDLNISIALSESPDYGHPQWYTNTRNACALTLSLWRRNDPKKDIELFEILKMLVESGASHKNDFELHEILKIKLLLVFTKTGSTQDFSVEDFNELTHNFLVRKRGGWSSTLYLYRDEAEKVLQLIVKYDRLDLLLVFEEFVQKHFPAYIEQNPFAQTILQYHSILSKYPTSNIVNAMVKRVDMADLIQTLEAFINFCSQTYAFRGEQDERVVKDRIESWISLLASHVGVSESTLKGDIDGELHSIHNFPFLKIMLSIAEVNKNKNIERLRKLPDKYVSYDDLPILQYLIETYSLRTEANRLVIMAAENLKVSAFKYLLPLASPEAQWQARASIRKGYSWEIDQTPRRLEMIQFFKETFNKLNNSNAALKLGVPLYQPDAKKINESLKMAMSNQDLEFVNEIVSTTQIREQDEHQFDFALSIDINKENIEFFTNLLNRLVDPKGHWTLLIPIVKSWLKVNRNADFLREYYRNHYINLAAFLPCVENAIRDDESKALSELLRQGILPNASILILDSNVVKCMTIMEFAMQQPKSFACQRLLLERGVVVQDQGQPLNAISSTLVDNYVVHNQHEILALLLKNNNSLGVVWCKASTYHKRSIIRKQPETARFFQSLLERVADFRRAVLKQDLEAVQKMIQDMPSVILPRILFDLLKQYIVGLLSNHPIVDAHIKSIDERYYVFKDANSFNMQSIEIISTLLHYMKTFKDSEILYLLHVFTLIRRFENHLKPSSASASAFASVSASMPQSSVSVLLEKIINIPCVAAHPALQWIDCFRCLDMDRLKRLLKNADPKLARYKPCLQITFSSNDDSDIIHVLLTLLPVGDKNPLILFLEIARETDFFSQRGKQASDFFGFLLKSNSYDNIMAKHESIINYFALSARWRLRPLKEALEAQYKLTLAEIATAEKNAAALSVFANGVLASPVKIQYSIMDIMPEILKYAGYNSFTRPQPDRVIPFTTIGTSTGSGRGLIFTKYYKNLMSGLGNRSHSASDLDPKDIKDCKEMAEIASITRINTAAASAATVSTATTATSASAGTQHEKSKNK